MARKKRKKEFVAQAGCLWISNPQKLPLLCLSLNFFFFPFHLARASSLRAFFVMKNTSSVKYSFSIIQETEERGS